MRPEVAVSYTISTSPVIRFVQALYITHGCSVAVLWFALPVMFKLLGKISLFCIDNIVFSIHFHNSIAITYLKHRSSKSFRSPEKTDRFLASKVFQLEE